MKPLSPHNSRILLNRRVYGNNDTEKCPDEELVEVSDKVIKKCAGVPLAIITIASLLATKGRNKMDWYEVYISIGTGMENSLDAENMRKVLSYSYYDLPYHLRTCLLYLSVFHEDSQINKDQLIRLWRAEGFIQYEEYRKSLFDIGESYFNELINRSMIQPVYDNVGVEIEFCRVHDMVLDLVRSISKEENFVTMLSDMNHKSVSTRIRRLCVDKEIDPSSTQGAWSMRQVRSIVFSHGFNQIFDLQSFKFLHVLELQDCKFSQGYSLKYLGSLFHLRYLNLCCTWIDQLPKEVENLQFLKILNLQCTKISHLPLNVVRQKYLLCLLVNWDTIVPNGIWSFRSLEELAWLRIDDESTNHMEELGLLTELRVLGIVFQTHKWNNQLGESLSKLRKIQKLLFRDSSDGQHNIGGLDAWVAPPYLRDLETRRFCLFSRLPAWMNNPSHLPNLLNLSIAIKEIKQEYVGILGRLPALSYLDLEVDYTYPGVTGKFAVCAGSFPSLKSCRLRGCVVPVVIQKGAMPRLTWLWFDYYVQEVKDATGRDGSIDMGLENLLSLQNVNVRLQSGGASKEEVEEAMSALRKAVGINPDKLHFWIS